MYKRQAGSQIVKGLKSQDRNFRFYKGIVNISAWDFRNFKYSFDKDEIVAEGEQQQRKRKERREDEEGKKNKREKEGRGCREERK